MWTTTYEKNLVSIKANDFEKGHVNDDWYIRFYRDNDQYIDFKVRIADNICYIVREMLKDLPFDVHLPEAKEYINLASVRTALYNSGVPKDLMPADMHIDMLLTTAIPSFLHRKKSYPVNDELDESMPITFYDDPQDEVNGEDKYAIICGEACKFNRDYKGFRLYMAGYAWLTYVLSGCYNDFWSKKCRYFAVDNNLTLIKGGNLAVIKERVNNYLRGGQVDE